MQIFFNQHTTQATPNPDVDDSCKMFKKLSRYDFGLKNVELGELNILRYPKPSYEHEHSTYTHTYRHAIIATPAPTHDFDELYKPT